MTDTTQKQHCPHCGQQIDPDTKSIGDYERAEGWTPEIVKQAAQDVGRNIFVGEVTLGHDPTKWLGLWCKDERDLTPFWNRARELREKSI